VKITPREELLMRRALDPASSPAEAAKAAEAFVNSLRKRRVNGYDFVRKTGATGPTPQQPPQQPKPEPKPQSPPQPDPKWDFMREQRARAQREATQDPPPPTSWPRPQPDQSSGTGCFSRVIGLIVIAFMGMCYNTCHPSKTYTPSRTTTAWSTPGAVPTPYRFRDWTPTPSPTPTATPVMRAELVATPTPVKRAELVNDLPLPQIEALVRNYLAATGDGRPICLKPWVADQLGRWYDTEYITREMAEAKVAGYYRQWPFQLTQLAGPYRWRAVSNDLYAIYQPIIWTGKGGSNQPVVVRRTFCTLVERIRGTWRISSAWNDASQ
jgi:hypothetical protein